MPGISSAGTQHAVGDLNHLIDHGSERRDEDAGEEADDQGEHELHRKRLRLEQSLLASSLTRMF